MAKRNTNRRRAAFSAIGLLVETGCGVFTLFLASRDASYSQALAAKQWLAALIDSAFARTLSNSVRRRPGRAPTPRTAIC